MHLGQKNLVIGIDASRANAAQRTGVEWYAYHLIQELKAVIPPSVHVVLYSREPLRDGLEVLPANFESRVLRWRWRLWTQLRLSYEMLVRPPDLLFVPAHTLPLILPRRSVITIHDLGFLSVPEAFSFGERVYHCLAAWCAARRATKLITVSDFSKREIVRALHVAEARVQVTPLAGNRAAFRPDLPVEDQEKVAARYGLRAGRPYFLFAGRLEYKKNLDGLLAAFSELVTLGSEADLVLVGRRGWGAEAAFERLSAASRDRVLELGYVATADLPFLYAGAAALVFPSRYEGFGLPVLEAFLCGTPVVAAATTSIPEVAGQAALLVAPDDVAGLAAAMRTILVDADLRWRLRQAGLVRAAEFSWRATAQATWQVLAQSLT